MAAPEQSDSGRDADISAYTWLRKYLHLQLQLHCCFCCLLHFKQDAHKYTRIDRMCGPCTCILFAADVATPPATCHTARPF